MIKNKKKYFTLIFAIFVGVGLVSILNIIPRTAKAEDSWYNSSWSKRQKITLNNSAHAETFTNFPLHLALNSSNFTFTDALTNGADFRPVTTSGTVLSYEIESWDQSAQTANIWINIPQVTASLSTEYFYIYYGNPSATDAASKTSVWNSNYRDVYHLGENLSLPTSYTLPIEPISIQGDTNNLYIGSQNNAGLRILSRSNYAVTKTLRASDNVERLYVRGHYLSFTGASNKGYIYDLDTDTYVATISGTALFRSTYIDENNRAYFGETDTGKIYYTDANFVGQSTVTIGTDDIRDIHSHGNELIVACNNNKVYLLDKSTLVVTQTFTDSSNSVEVAKIDDNYIWFGSDHQKAWIKNSTSPYTTVATLHGPTNDVTGIDYDDGYWFVSSDDGNLYIYSASTYQLANIVTGETGSGIEQFWLDKTTNQIFYVRGHNNSGQHEFKLYIQNYPSSVINYTTHLDSTSYGSDLVGTPSATTVTGKIGLATNFAGIKSYLAQKPVYNSGLPGSYPSVTNNQAFYFAQGANFGPYLGDGILNNYFLRYNTGSLFEAGYLGSSGAGETVTSRVNNPGFENSFSGGLASSWSKEYASHTYSDETTVVHSGSHAQKVTATAANQHLGIRQNVSLGVGKLFRFSAWVYSSSGDPVIFNVGSHVNTFNPTALTWTQLSGYVTSAADTKFRIYTSATNVAIGEYLIIDDVVVDEITDLPSGQGAKFYSSKTGSTNALALADAGLDQNNILHAGIYKSSLQTQGSLTLEAWIYPTSDIGDGYLAGTWSNNQGYLLYRSGQKIYGKIGSTLIDTGATDLPSGSWYYVVFTANGSTQNIYINGNSYVTESNSLNLPVIANHFTLGLSPLDSTMPYTGLLDEVRVSESLASSALVSAQYQNMSDNNFVTISSVENHPLPTSTSTSTSSTTSTAPTNSSTSCDDIPASAPWIYASTSDTPTSIHLYFASPTLDITSYSLEYGNATGIYSWGINIFGDKDSRELTINELAPNTRYYFRLRSNRGCTTSPWSAEFIGSTRTIFSPYLKLSPQLKVTPLTPTPPSPEPKIHNLPEAINSPWTNSLKIFHNLGNLLFDFFRSITKSKVL